MKKQHRSDDRTIQVVNEACRIINERVNASVLQLRKESAKAQRSIESAADEVKMMHKALFCESGVLAKEMEVFRDELAKIRIDAIAEFRGMSEDALSSAADILSERYKSRKRRVSRL